jgi:hypothetical protein
VIAGARRARAPSFKRRGFFFARARDGDDGSDGGNVGRS